MHMDLRVGSALFLLASHAQTARPTPPLAADCTGDEVQIWTERLERMAGALVAVHVR